MCQDWKIKTRKDGSIKDFEALVDDYFSQGIWLKLIDDRIQEEEVWQSLEMINNFYNFIN
jgi:hypothetical protein